MVFGKKPNPEAQILTCPYYELEYPFLERLRLSRFTSILSDLQSLKLLLPRLPIRLKKIAKAFEPDMVISLMQHITYYHPAYLFAKKNKLPFILFCHDDVEDFSRIHPGFKRILIQLNSKIYRAASKRICISPEMAEKWKVKYGVGSDFLYPIASKALTAKAIDLDHLKPKKQLKIGYAGSLAYGYKEGINELLPVLQKTGALLKIYRYEDSSLPSSKYLTYGGFSKTAEETFEKIKKECDAVILPYSSDEKFKDLYTTHFPSKIPEYVLLGMPIIVIGPNYANGVKWAMTKSGIFSGNLSSLEDILKSISLDMIKLKEAILSLKDIDDFNPDQINTKFIRIVNNASKAD